MNSQSESNYRGIGCRKIARPKLKESSNGTKFSTLPHLNNRFSKFQFKNSLILVAVCFAVASCSSRGNSQAEELEVEWIELQSVLKSCVGVFDGERKNIETSGFPNGPLLGNGSTGVVSSGTGNWQKFHITNLNYWDGRYTPDSLEETRKKGFFWGTTGVKALAIGGITICEDTEDDSEIVQYQDMLNAEVRTSASINIRTWVSATDQMLVSELTTKDDYPVSISVETWTLVSEGSKIDHNSGNTLSSIRNKKKSSEHLIYDIKSGIKGDEIAWATRQTTVDTTHKFVCRAALATRILGAEITPEIKGNNVAVTNFMLKPGDTVKVVTVVEVVKDDTHHLEDAINKVRAIKISGIDRLYEAHLDWWKNYWLKSYIRTYDEQLEKYYFGSLYITACSNRPSNNPSPLHGPWVTTDNPAWKSNYKLSYNFQMTYSGVCSSNRTELLWPYMDIVFGFMPEAQRRSESGYDFNLATGWRWKNKDGSLKFPNGIKGGLLYPLGIGGYGIMSEDSYSGMLGMGAWAAAPCIWYYNSTQDEEFLLNRLYPLLKKLALFWENYLVKEEGRWVIKYSGASERYSNDAINATIDIAVVRYLFRNLIPMSETLKMDQEKRGLWQDIVTNLSQPAMRERGGRTIFVESENMPLEKPWPGYLMLSYPGMEVTLDSDSELREIYAATVDYTKPWESANSPGYFWASAAHAGYPSEALLEKFRNLLNVHMSNNYNVGVSGHGTEGTASLEYINYSMMSGNLGYICIFPSWPLHNAKFKRLRADGAFLVSATKKAGIIQDVFIYSEKGRPCTVLNPWPGKEMKVYDGKEQVQTSVQDNKYTFETWTGHTYFLSH